MAAISFPLPGNVLHDQPQILDFDKIATFIGGNGSGKSTILKSIFDEKLDGNTYQDYKIVCFSSGQNESYSERFGDYLNSERSKRNALNLDCFYYDKSWSKLLILLATTGRHDGFVRNFLKQNNYVTENEFDEDESTKLSFNVKVDKSYTNLVRQALEDEGKGETDVITNKAYHRTLRNFINSLISDGYNFEEPLDLFNIELNQDVLSGVSFEADDHASFDSMVMFFTQAADNNYFIVKDSFNLTFKKGGKTLRLEELSDGEYQLLFLYALIDLFDSENSLFLLDEADSHLHYKNIEKLWNVYSEAKGGIITTTHLLDSITKAGPDRLRIVENGEIQHADSSFKLLQRLEALSEVEATQYKIVSMYKNIVVMDHAHDWEIFKLLAKRKLSVDENSEKEIIKNFSEFICISISSGFTAGLDKNMFGDNKINWLKNYEIALKKLQSKTENVFLICDRDDFPISFIGTEKFPFVVKGHGFKSKKHQGNKKDKSKVLSLTALLSWKRREIKHYLLSYSALIDDIEAINTGMDLSDKCKLLVGNSGDYKTDGKYNLQLASLDSDPLKKIVDPYINIHEQGFCIEKAQAFVNTIPKEEISEDIVNMYKYLVGVNE